MIKLNFYKVLIILTIFGIGYSYIVIAGNPFSKTTYDSNPRDNLYETCKNQGDNFLEPCNRYFKDLLDQWSQRKFDNKIIDLAIDLRKEQLVQRNKDHLTVLLLACEIDSKRLGTYNEASKILGKEE